MTEKLLTGTLSLNTNQKPNPEYIEDLITIQNSSYNFRRENQASIPHVKSTTPGID